MNSSGLWSLVLLSVLMLTSCKKNALKKPTDVDIVMDITRGQSGTNELEFTSGTIYLESFEFAGTRVEGEPFEFEREYPSGLAINFDPNQAIEDLHFDIPQGEYLSLEVEFETYAESQNSIELNGIYTNSSQVTYPVRFELVSDQNFSISGESEDGSGTIQLNKDIAEMPVIELDPIYWFDIITANMWDNADLVDVNGTPTILINENENAAIYDLIVDRIDDSAEMRW